MPAEKIPSPADAPTMSARSLLRQIKRRGGRIYRMRQTLVFVLMNDGELAEWLLALGGKTYVPRGAEQTLMAAPLGAFRMAKGGDPTWDIYVHTIPTLGDESVWEAAATFDHVGLYEVGDEEPV
jgi:hypothetical protein